jgi:hypothetical protein
VGSSEWKAILEAYSAMASPPWPTFLIIGAAKAGTTSLYWYLSQHPEVYMSPIKEPAFWAFGESDHHFTGPGDVDRVAIRTVEQYQRLFTARIAERASGEASVQYLFSTRAADRIRQRLPEMRLIAILRQPAERAFSHFLMHQRYGIEPLTDFEAALAAEPARLRAGWHPTWLYRQRGYYFQQLQVYYERFRRDQIMVCLYDDLVADPLALMRRIYEFIDVDPSFVATIERHNVGGVLPRSRRLVAGLRSPVVRTFSNRLLPTGLRERLVKVARKRLFVRVSLPDDLRAELTDGYRGDITQLQQLIGRDLALWLC